MSKKKQAWEMNYTELYDDWASRYAFGTKGEMSVHEAKEVHIKWKKLGTEARLGIL